MSKSNKLTGGQAAVQALKKEKTKHVFGLIGSATMEMFDALYHEKDIKFIGVRDERTGTHMADGYARASNRPGVILAGKNDVVSIVGSWSQHYNSWKNTKNLYLIKYEDLIKNTYIEINKLFLFLKKECNLSINNNINNINEIIESTSFEKLKNMENQKLLNLPVQNGKKFFYLGKENNWKNILDKKFTKDIEKIFKYEMTELGYLF